MSQHDITYDASMGRWEPGAAGRLREAALELYVDRGYEQTTVADIAERAGVTARTFFRHFTDKREVLFAGSEVLEQAMVDAVAGAPHDAAPLEAVAAALDVVGELIGRDHAFSRRRQSVITANPELHERELIKMARLADALTAALVDRGTPADQARLTAETGTTVFRIGFERWVSGPAKGDLATTLRESMAQLRGLVGG
jgi:AcrR family transcriptional regulator